LAVALGHDGRAPSRRSSRVRTEAEVRTIANGLAERDPANESTYAENADAYVERSDSLDDTYAERLSGRTRDTVLVAGHNSVRYLAHRYDFHVEALTGLAPDAEPTPKDVRRAQSVVDEHDFEYVLAPVFESDRAATQLVRETDAKEALPLTPVPTLTEEWNEKEWGYLDVMEQVNLRSLERALGSNERPRTRRRDVLVRRATGGRGRLSDRGVGRLPGTRRSERVRKDDAVETHAGAVAPGRGVGHALRPAGVRVRRRTRVGYVSQEATGAAGGMPVTVREVVTMGRYPHVGLGRFGKRDTDRIAEALETVGVAHLADRRFSTLSRGQKQRVVIARALAADADLLALDEPTVGVNAESRESFYELLRELNRDGLTILLVEHDIGVVTAFTTRVACLNLTRGDVELLVVLSALVVAAVLLSYRKLVYVTFDESAARIAGIDVRLLNRLLVVLTAMVVGGAMQMMGVILVAAMLVVPVAAATQLAGSFKQSVAYAVVAAQVAVLSGTTLSYAYGIAAGGTIVLVAIAVYLGAAVAGRLGVVGAG
jgi:ABC-type lipoprotein export system ATPase subunit